MNMLFLPNLDIWGTIFDFLPPVDLIHFGQASRTAREAVTNYNQLAFDITRLLSPYFSDEETKAFRRLQLFTGTVISGSTAVQFFSRTTYPESDLDIYVERRYCRDVAWWLMSIEYKYKPARADQPTSLIEASNAPTVEPQTLLQGDRSEPEYLALGVEDIFDFVRVGSERKMQLISTLRCPMDVILNYHSTCVMNVITHNMAYALYPYATFQQRRALVCGANGNRRNKARDKYWKRGWEVEDSIDTCEERDRRSDFAFGRRWVGDGRCWTIPLRPRLSEGLIRDCITSNSWSIQHPLRQNSCMWFMDAESRNLRFHYLCADLEMLTAFRTVTSPSSVDDDEVNEHLIARLQAWGDAIPGGVRHTI